MYDFSREKVHKIVRRPEAGVELYRMIATAHVNDYLQMACLSLDLGSLPVNECAQWLTPISSGAIAWAYAPIYSRIAWTLRVNRRICPRTFNKSALLRTSVKINNKIRFIST